MILTSFSSDVDLMVLEPLLIKGELCLVTSGESGSLDQVSAMGLANAPLEKAWKSVTDYEGYPKWMPGVKKTRVRTLPDGQVQVAYELDSPGVKIKYKMIHTHHSPGRIEGRLADRRGSIKDGAWLWEFIPHKDMRKTFVMVSMYLDLKGSNWLLKKLLDSQPALEHGLNVGSGTIALRAVIKRAESL